MTTIKIISGAPEVEVPGIGIVETNVPITVTPEQEASFELATGKSLADSHTEGRFEVNSLVGVNSPVGKVTEPPAAPPVEVPLHDDDKDGGEE